MAHNQQRTKQISAKPRSSRLKALALSVGALCSTVLPPPPQPVHLSTTPSNIARHVKVNPTKSRTLAAIPLEALGIKKEEYVGERELRRRKTTRYSEAEQEIMELEEWEVATQWFRDLQFFWAALASLGGIYVLYKGGVMWENWIQEQERKDMEEEIELTGTFIDPRAVRKDEDGEQGQGRGKNKAPPKKGDDPDSPPASDRDSLEKLFGKS